jgi:hypothetical protein
MIESAFLFNITWTVSGNVWIVGFCREHAHVTYYMKNVYYWEELKNDDNTMCTLYMVMFYTHLLVVWTVLKFTELLGA